MPFINYAAQEINFKIVYYGAGMSGKTTNLQHIYSKTSPQAKGNLVSLANTGERTIFFDFLPLSIGTIRGFRTRFHLYSVPGQVFYDASRQVILRGIDAAVFVIDSTPERMDANLESFDNLATNLHLLGQDPQSFPLVVQYNKRDHEQAIPLANLKPRFNRRGVPEFEAVASQGRGVFETLKSIGKMALRSLK